MIQLFNLGKRYMMGEEPFMALQGVNLHIERNEYVALIGPSGSGKSTLMNLLGCLDTPSEGRYVLNGRDTSDMDDVELARVRNREIGFIFQSFHLLPRLTVLQNVMQPLVYRGIPRPERERLATESLTRVGLANRLGHRPNQLSGGQRQRVAVARALVGKPSLILADEPTGNLHSAQGREIMELFRKLNEQGTTIIQVTHSEANAEYGHRIIELFDGWISSERRTATAGV